MRTLTYVDLTHYFTAVSETMIMDVNVVSTSYIRFSLICLVFHHSLANFDM